MDVRESVGVSGRDTVFVSRQSKASAVARNLELFREKALRRRVQRRRMRQLCWSVTEEKGDFTFASVKRRPEDFLVKLNQRQGTNLE